MRNLPHPATFLEPSPQLTKVIEELEAGTYPQTEDAIWRQDLPHDLRVRLARATGATDRQIARAEREDQQRLAHEADPHNVPREIPVDDEEFGTDAWTAGWSDDEN